MQLLSRQKRVIILSVIGIIIFSFVLGIFLYSRDKKGESIDTPSGETISDPKNQQPESFGAGNEITYFGTSDLIDSGISEFMVDTFRQQMSEYSKKNSNYIKSISVYVKTIQTKDTDSKTITSFDIQVNHKDKMTVSLNYVGLLDVTIIIKDSSGKEVFNSGEINYQDPNQDYTGDGVPPEQQ